MGVERIIRISGTSSVSWPAIRSRLLETGEAPEMRMIDSDLALPDEEPPEDWRELRLALRGGMVTLQRREGALACVIWGNADAALKQSWNLLIWAAAVASDEIIVDERNFSAAEFAAAHHLLDS